MTKETTQSEPGEATLRREQPVWVTTLIKLVWPLLALVLLLVIGAINVDGFLWVGVREGRLLGYPVAIALNSTQVMLLALGMCLVIATGGIDLSVGAVMAITAATAAEAINSGMSPWIVVPMSIGVATLAGLWNGVLVAYLGIAPIVATLVLMVAGRGVAQLITQGQITNFNHPAMVFIGQGMVFGIPFALLLAGGLFIVTLVLVRMTALGLMIETIGENPTTARYVGVPVSTVKLLTYAFAGVCAGLAGLVSAALIRSADANNAGLFMELDAIFAVVVGGTALTGGRFYLTGAIVGALLLQTLTTVILALDVEPQLIPLPKAIVIIGVILLQSPAFRRKIIWFAGAFRSERRAAA